MEYAIAVWVVMGENNLGKLERTRSSLKENYRSQISFITSTKQLQRSSLGLCQWGQESDSL